VTEEYHKKSICKPTDGAKHSVDKMYHY